MARATFGGTAGDFIAVSGPGGVVRTAPATLTLWSADSGGVRYTDLVLDGAAVSAIPVGPNGQVPAFQGPNNVAALWADAGFRRVRLVSEKTAETLASDGFIASQVADPGSDTSAALDSNYAPGGSAGNIDAEQASEITARTTFCDDFTTKPDGPLSAGAVSNSGHTYTVLGQIPWHIEDGALTHTQTNPATTQSSYLGVNLGADIAYIWADFEVPTGVDPQEAIVLIASAGEFTGTPAYEYADASAHAIFADSNFRYDSLQATHPGLVTTTLGRGQYPALTPGAYRIAVTLDDDLATVTAPDGRMWRVDRSALIADRNGPWATLQLNANAGTRKMLRVLRWGAETVPRTERGPYASLGDLARAVSRPGRVSAMQTSGANVATAIGTSLSAKLYGISHPVPSSRRILAEGWAWFQEDVLTARDTSALLLGIYPAGVSGYGKLTTVYSGYTPANATVDAVAFADRQANMTSYANGGLLPFALILDLDPAFTVGELIDFQVKAQANAAGRFTFIDSGDASGGTATIRRSTLKITDLGPA